MAASFIGFGAFLRSVDFELLRGLATVPVIWALPGQVVFVDSIHKSLGLAATSLAVSITAVRLMPLTVLVLAQTRVKGAARWPELIAAHFVAITLWLLSNQKIENVPHRRRLPWLIGLGGMLCGAMIVFSTLGYFLADRLPLPLAASLVFFTRVFSRVFAQRHPLAIRIWRARAWSNHRAAEPTGSPRNSIFSSPASPAAAWPICSVGSSGSYADEPRVGLSPCRRCRDLCLAFLGVAASRQMAIESPLILWVKSVATALIAALVVRASSLPGARRVGSCASDS